jgi:uncharacterized lipoprotein YehR (DUF1307 family)
MLEKTLEDFYTKIDKLKTEESELLKLAQVNQKDKFHVLRGKQVSEEMMWYEVMNLGKDCEAAKVLREIYPDLFKVVDELHTTHEELNKYSKEVIGVDPQRMNLLDLIKVIKAVNGNS